MEKGGQQQRDVNAQETPVGELGGNATSLFITFVLSATFAALVFFPSSILHQVPEGYVGAYWKGGALLKTTSEPGFHLKLPIITKYKAIKITPQTDQVKDIACATKGGVVINFEKIEIVNQLRKEYVYDNLIQYGMNFHNSCIYDAIQHEISQFCSSHSLQQVYDDNYSQIDERMKDALQGVGIEIIKVRITKPKIPHSVMREYELLEEERVRVLIAIEKLRVAEKEAETKKLVAISEADAEYYRVLKDVEANMLKLKLHFQIHRCYCSY